MTNEEKKKALSRYLFCKERVKVLMERKKMYQKSIYSLKSPSLSGMPTAHEPHGVDDMVIKCITQTEDIDRQLEKLTKKMTFIRKIIESVENLKYRSILEMRFIDGMTNKEIRGVLGDIGQTALTFHTKNALKNLPLTEEYMKLYDEQ